MLCVKLVNILQISKKNPLKLMCFCLLCSPTGSLTRSEVFANEKYILFKVKAMSSYDDTTSQEQTRSGIKIEKF